MKAIESESVVCTVAGPDDSRDIAALLHENPMDGAYAIAMTRDPDPFVSDGCALRSVFVIARDKQTGAPVGLCERVVREAYLDGEPRHLPYLGALRVSRSHRGRIGVLRAGFAMMRAAEQPEDAPFALTSIAQGNAAAERVLTAGLRGLPHYSAIAGYSTFALRTRKRRVDAAIAPARSGDLAELAAFLNTLNMRLQFAPVWSEQRLRALSGHGLPCDKILVRRRGGEIEGCVAVWDQRAFRQTRVQRYPAWLGAMRPLVNLAAPLIGLPHLPSTGEALSQASLSMLVVRSGDPDIFTTMVDAGLDLARRSDVDIAAVGFATEHPWRTALLARRRALEYRSTLFRVAWPGERQETEPPQALRVGPELAFL